MIYLDRNKDGRINTLDQEYIPVAQPKLTGGFNLSAAWKGFSIAASLSFSTGSKIYNLDDQLTRVYSIDFTGVMKNKIEWALDRWTKPGDESYYPRAVVGVHGAGQTTDWNTRPSTQYLFSASYLRFRNLTLAYQIPGSILSQLRIPAIRVHASCQNLFIVKDRKLKMSDPEVGLAGLQQAAVPLPRTVAFGIDITL
jgi:TonB-dependent starch-binding outer membrane protein SusC